MILAFVFMLASGLFHGEISVVMLSFVLASLNQQKAMIQTKSNDSRNREFEINSVSGVLTSRGHT